MATLFLLFLLLFAGMTNPILLLLAVMAIGLFGVAPL